MLELTLDEAIKHCKENVQKETQNGNLQCAIEHNQLAMWLSQLKESKAKATPSLNRRPSQGSVKATCRPHKPTLQVRVLALL